MFGNEFVRSHLKISRPSSGYMSKEWGRQRNAVAIGRGLSKEWSRRRNEVAIGMGL